MDMRLYFKVMKILYNSKEVAVVFPLNKNTQKDFSVTY